ncbi:MAG: sugar ABC transporter permease [Clostridia bacterium]|nr:sugar ABC transporter permease [Clostridia bacterium]
MASLGVVFLLVFNYAPMYGIILAFKKGDYVIDIRKAIFESSWVGFKNFEKFLIDPQFKDVIVNTLCLNLLSLLINFPAPIIFALFINEVRNKTFKKTIQTISYFPYFLSWIVFGGIILNIINPQTGILSDLLMRLKLIDAPLNLGRSEYTWGVLIVTALIKGVGWGSVIYVAAIAGIDTAMYEAADIDGAGRWGKMWFITLPSIIPTITVYLILSISNLLNSGFEQIYVFQNQINLGASEVIDTYVYKYGVLNKRYSYTTAIGLLKSIISLVLLISANFISKKITGKGIY